MMLMAGDVAQQRHDNPSESGANGDVGLRQAMVLGHLDIEPFDHERSAAGTYELGFTAHDSALDRPALDRKRGEFRARFSEAEIEITGDSPEPAIANLKSLIVATYEDLVDAAAEVLGHRQRRQRRVRADLLRYDGAAEV